MHIPDGFLSPITYAATTVAAAALLFIAFKKIRVGEEEERLGQLAASVSLVFLGQMIAIPLPGGTSGHAVGVAMLTLLFGPWRAMVAIGILLAIEALLFGNGGVTTWGLNTLAMGCVGSVVTWLVWQATSRWPIVWRYALAGYLSVSVASLLVAVVLGVQPLIAHDASGRPLYFPFGLEVTLGAITGMHLVLFGPLEAILTVGAMKVLTNERLGIGYDQREA